MCIFTYCMLSGGAIYGEQDVINFPKASQQRTDPHFPISKVWVSFLLACLWTSASICDASLDISFCPVLPFSNLNLTIFFVIVVTMVPVLHLLLST